MPTPIYSYKPCFVFCLSNAGMVNYLDLDPDAPFAVAFTDKGMNWAAKIVSIGALFGRLTACDLKMDHIADSAIRVAADVDTPLIEPPLGWICGIGILIILGHIPLAPYLHTLHTISYAGCTNSNYGGILGQSRIFLTMARAGLLPKGMVRAHP